MTKRVSVKDVASRAQVSVGTVSNFLNDTKPLSDVTRRQIEVAIAELGYRPNAVARSLRTARTRTLGMIVPSIANPFYTSIFEGAEAEALNSGYSLTLGVTHYDRQVMRDYVETFRGGQVDGIIVDGYSTYFGQDRLAPRDVPLVVIEPPDNTIEYSTIRIDNGKASRDAVNHLLERGHRRIATIIPSRAGPRFQGYCAALEAAGIALDDRLIMEFPDGVSGRAHGGQRALFELGQTAMSRLLDQARFTAVFVSLDAFAVGAIRTLQERRLRVPEDVAVVGFDDIAIASMVTPSLTTIAQPHALMGRLAVRTLVQQLQGDRYSGPVHHVLDHQLIVREST